MAVFVDTSALYALMDADDVEHGAARAWFEDNLGDPLVTHSYCVVETAALVQRRLGPEATRALMGDLLGALEVGYVDERLHMLATSAYLAAPTGPSLVDRVSFQFMRSRRIDRAFAFDAHFRREGFSLLPWGWAR